MTDRGRGGNGSDSARVERSTSLANEEGLRALGDQMGVPARLAPSGSAKRAPAGAPDRSNGTAAVANEAGLAALGEEMRRPQPGRSARRHTAAHSRRRGRLRRTLVIGLAILCCWSSAVAGYAYYLTHDLNRVEVRGLSGGLSPPARRPARRTS